VISTSAVSKRDAIRAVTHAIPHRVRLTVSFATHSLFHGAAFLAHLYSPEVAGRPAKHLGPLHPRGQALLPSRCFPAMEVPRTTCQNPRGRREFPRMELMAVLPFRNGPAKKRKCARTNGFERAHQEKSARRSYRELVFTSFARLLAATYGTVTVLSRRTNSAVCSGIFTSLPLRATT
jgi:hypothetical protein